MKRRLVVGIVCGVAWAWLPAGPASADGLVLDDVSVDATEEGDGYAVDIPVLNTRAAPVVLDESLRLVDSPCTATVADPTVLGLRSTTVKLTFDEDCFGDGSAVAVDLDARGPLPAVTIAKPSTGSPWWPFAVGGLAALLLAAAAFLVGRDKIAKVDAVRRRSNDPETPEGKERLKAYADLKKRVNACFEYLGQDPPAWKPPFGAPNVGDVDAAGGSSPGAIETPPYTWESQVAGLEAGWSFKDSWAANLTVATTAFVALLNSADTLTAVLGDEDESALAMMTVAGLISAVLIAVATTVVKLVGPDPTKVTAGGLILSTALVVAAAGLQVFVVGLTAVTLATGWLATSIAAVIALGVLAALLVYAYKTLGAALGKAEKPDPVLTVPADAFVAWKVEAQWQKAVVCDRIKQTYAGYLSPEGPTTERDTVVQAYVPPLLAAGLGATRLRASII